MISTAPATSARYNVLVSAPMLPGCCFLCRSTVSAAKPAADLGISQPKFGRFYLCISCLQDIMVAFNLEPAPKEPKPAVATLSREDLKKAVDELRDTTTDHINRLASLFITNSDLLHDEVSGESDGEPEGKRESAISPAGQNDRATKRKGPPSLPADTSDNPFDRL